MFFFLKIVKVRELFQDLRIIMCALDCFLVRLRNVINVVKKALVEWLTIVINDFW